MPFLSRGFKRHQALLLYIPHKHGSINLDTQHKETQAHAATFMEKTLRTDRFWSHVLPQQKLTDLIPRVSSESDVCYGHMNMKADSPSLMKSRFIHLQYFTPMPLIFTFNFRLKFHSVPFTGEGASAWHSSSISILHIA
jgi:hypothetical protein